MAWNTYSVCWKPLKTLDEESLPAWGYWALGSGKDQDPMVKEDSAFPVCLLVSHCFSAIQQTMAISICCSHWDKAYFHCSIRAFQSFQQPACIWFPKKHQLVGKTWALGYSRMEGSHSIWIVGCHPWGPVLVLYPWSNWAHNTEPQLGRRHSTGRKKNQQVSYVAWYTWLYVLNYHYHVSPVYWNPVTSHSY